MEQKKVSKIDFLIPTAIISIFMIGYIAIIEPNNTTEMGLILLNGLAIRLSIYIGYSLSKFDKSKYKYMSSIISLKLLTIGTLMLPIVTLSWSINYYIKLEDFPIGITLGTASLIISGIILALKDLEFGFVDR